MYYFQVLRENSTFYIKNLELYSTEGFFQDKIAWIHIDKYLWMLILIDNEGKVFLIY